MSKVRYIVLLAAGFLVTGLICKAQTDTVFNRKDKAGLKQGVWKLWLRRDTSVSLLGIVTYKDDELDGLCVYYNPDGGKSSERYYRKGKLDGHSIVYRPDGTLHYEEDMTDDRVNGIKKFYDASGRPDGEQEYRNGAKTGVYRIYSSTTGRIVLESYMIDGVENGTRKVYSDDELHELVEELEFKNGVYISDRHYVHGNLVQEEKFDYDAQIKRKEKLKGRLKGSGDR